MYLLRYESLNFQLKELPVGFEPTTCSLQVSCTTAVLREQISTPNIQIKSLSDIDANNKYFIDQKNSSF